MNYFFFKLYPPRPTFPADMTSAERTLMQKHVAYWSALMAQGKVIAFGPVADPVDPYGIGLLQIGDDENADLLGANDPVIVADLGFRFEVYPMPRVLVRDFDA
jgi:hypothetical protein